MPQRWNVALIDPDVVSRATLRGRVEAAGGRVSVELDSWALAPSSALQPDVHVVVGDLAGARAELPTLARPVVLVTENGARVPVTAVRAREVMAVLLKPVRAPHLRAVLDIAIARFTERRDVERRLDERKTIERAKGRVMERWAVGEDAAYGLLRRTAMNSRRPLADVAREILAAG
jgi:two-component system, response regulator / RNA-binding antiterminator